MNANAAEVARPSEDRGRLLLVGALSPEWAAMSTALRDSFPRVDITEVAPSVSPADLQTALGGTASGDVVVIVDLRSDPIRGISTVAACRHAVPAAPVIVVAANPSQELVRRMRLTGVFYLALDPVGPEELRHAVASAFEAAARRRPRTSACRDRQRILLIDDDRDFLASAAALLESQGYSVATASSGREGLARVEQQAPDLIVLDIMMEDDWAGYAVNQRIKFGPGFEDVRHLPILMVSSIPVDPATRFARAGEVDMVTPDAYLTKPLDIPAFLERVRLLLGESGAEVLS